MFIIVQVNEDAKIITGPLVKEVEESSLFSTLFDSVFSGNYFHQNVRVEVRKTETRPWVPVQEGLQGKLLLMKTLGFIYLKYILLLCDFVVPLSQIHILNAFTSSLPVYQQNGVYNEYYQRMKKKKSQLTRLELFQLANFIELSLAEPWASKDFWQEVVLNVFELTSMMKKYFDHLDNTNNNMKALHESENPAREPSTNCNVRLISKCDEREIDSRYHSLDSDLTNRELFDFIDLNLYVPDDPIKKHDFIRNIQLSVLTGLYR
ncbi:unnamed protein product [Rhizophagus irregularis]|nr:unnamed protein product [Rhizophagus irregularis]